MPWWERYDDPTLCLIGHYWRVALPEEDRFAALWKRAGSADAPKAADVRPLIDGSVRRLLVDLYPEARRILS